jgi:hypothetical protein
LSEVENAKADLHAQLELEGVVMRSTHAMLSDAGDTAIQVDKKLELLNLRISEVCTVLTTEKRARCELEQVLWIEQQRVKDLGGSLMESKQAADDYLKECNSLFGLVQQVWDDKAALEGQVTMMLSLHGSAAWSTAFLSLKISFSVST